MQFWYEPNAAWPAEQTGANGLKIRCQGPGLSGSNTHDIEQLAHLVFSWWGEWSPPCPFGTAVCSLRTRVQPNQGADWAGVDIDDAGLTGASVQCCDY